MEAENCGKDRVIGDHLRTQERTRRSRIQMDFRGRREADGATLERSEFPPVSVLPEWARATCGDASADELNYDPEE